MRLLTVGQKFPILQVKKQALFWKFESRTNRVSIISADLYKFILINGLLTFNFLAWRATKKFSEAAALHSAIYAQDIYNNALTTGVKTCSGTSFAKALNNVTERIRTEATINRAPTKTPTENHRCSKYGWNWPNLKNDLLNRVVYHRTWNNDREIPLFSRNSLYFREYFL